MSSPRLEAHPDDEAGWSSRRRFVAAASLSAVPAAVVPPLRGAAAADDGDDAPLIVPLRYAPSISAYVLSYSVGGSTFSAIVDTGSPFLLVPSYCPEVLKWGCYDPSSSRPSGLAPTYEQFSSNEGRVEWRIAPFSFLTVDASTGRTGPLDPALFPGDLTFGVASESLMDGPGGIFLGLVRDTSSRIRPSFLGQTEVSAFAIDLRPGARNGGRHLALSRSGGRDWISGDSIPLVRDLTTRYGDPTVHYVAVADSLSVNGFPLGQDPPVGGGASSRMGERKAKEKKKKKTYVIFDTGCSGMEISPDLYDERYGAARANREKSLWGRVEVSFATERGGTVTLGADRPLTTPFGTDRPWKRRFDDAHLVIIGLAFLDGKRLSVDIDGQKLWVED